MTRRTTRLAAAAAACLALALHPSHAGAQAEADSAQATWSYSAWGGLARNSPDNLWGAERGRDVAVAALRFMRHTPHTGRFVVDYYVDVIPVAWVSMPRVAGPPACEDLDGAAPVPETPAGGTVVCVLDGAVKTSAPGFGAAPFGVQARVRLFDRVRPFVAMNAGMLWFTRPVPSERASQLNFTADAGAGLLIGRAGRPGLMLGYKFHHISNGGTAASNPGVDGHMLYAGVLRVPR